MKTYRLPFILILLQLVFIHSVNAQKSTTATGTFDFYVPKSMTLSEAEKYACNRARDSAVMKVFEQKISGEVQTLISGGVERVTATFVSEMIGEWLGDEKPPQITTISTDPLVLRCRVKGKVREKPANSAELNIRTLNCPSSACATEQFTDGQSFYMALKSSKTGFVSMFMDNGTETFQVLPYSSDREKGINQVFIDRNRNYVFFSREDAEEEQKHKVDELELFAEAPGVEPIVLFVLFSENQFNNPLVTETDHNRFLNNKQFSEYKMPDAMDSEDFNRWLLRLRQTNPTLQAVRKLVTVRR